MQDQPELLCAYCSKPTDGPMLSLPCVQCEGERVSYVGQNLAHVKCALKEIGRLLDPEGYHSLYHPVWTFSWFSQAGTPLGCITWDQCLDR